MSITGILLITFSVLELLIICAIIRLLYMQSAINDLFSGYRRPSVKEVIKVEQELKFFSFRKNKKVI